MILYFSGSGNSLAIARRLGETLHEQIIPFREALSIDLSNEKRIGLVYPTYWLDAAKPVRDLVPKLNISPSAYVFHHLRGANQQRRLVGAKTVGRERCKSRLLQQDSRSRQ